MKLVIGNYEVEIKAKYTFEDRANATATKYFLNMISSALSAQADKEISLGCPACADHTLKMSDQIYNFLDEKHFYDDIRKEIKNK